MNNNFKIMKPNERKIMLLAFLAHIMVQISSAQYVFTDTVTTDQTNCTVTPYNDSADPSDIQISENSTCYYDSDCAVYGTQFCCAYFRLAQDP